MSSPHERESLLILGGGGAVGGLFARALADRYEVRTADLRDGTGVDLVADARAPEIVEAVRESAVVILALPETVAEEAIAVYADALTAEHLVVDTLSVKSAYLERVEALGIPSEVLSLNPMFAPDLGFEGRNVACVAVRGGDRSERFRRAIEGKGATLVEVNAADHDRLTAALQTAGHAAVIAFGKALGVLGYDAERMRPLWTPPHRVLLALLARMGNIDPEVYRDIQTGNPAASEARAALRVGLTELEAARDDPAAFAKLMRSALEPLGGAREELGDLAVELFGQT